MFSRSRRFTGARRIIVLRVTHAARSVCDLIYHFRLFVRFREVSAARGPSPIPAKESTPPKNRPEAKTKNFNNFMLMYFFFFPGIRDPFIRYIDVFPNAPLPRARISREQSSSSSSFSHAPRDARAQKYYTGVTYTNSSLIRNRSIYVHGARVHGTMMMMIMLRYNNTLSRTPAAQRMFCTRRIVVVHNIGGCEITFVFLLRLPVFRSRVHLCGTTNRRLVKSYSTDTRYCDVHTAATSLYTTAIY